MSSSTHHDVDINPKTIQEPKSLNHTVESTLIDSDTDERKTENEKSDVEAPPERTVAPEDDFPDGGVRAWLVVFGAMCVTFSTFGYVLAWGVFQSYYGETLLRDYSPSDIAWIGSIQYALIFIPGLLTGRMFDLGYFRIPLFAASALLVVATILTAQCTKYWHFILCQGIAIGLACGTIFGPTLSTISHWFKKRRGLALGITAVGSSIGGTIFPIAARKLIPLVGFPWTMRILGFILLVSTGMANLTMRRRLPPVNHPGGLFNLKAFESRPFTIYCLASFVTFLGLYTVLTYIDLSAVKSGVSPDFAFYLVAIANASSGIGRYTAGHVSDHVGPLNTIIPSTAIAAILTYAWPFAHSEAALIVIAVLYGFASGAFVALLPSPVMAFGDHKDVGRRIGMAMTVLSMGALAGPPISGAINSATGGFKAVGYFAGSMVLVAIIMLIVVRQLVLKQLWGKF